MALPSLPPVRDGLVAAYSFDEGAGTDVTDSSGNSNVGVVANATWSTQGRFGKALEFTDGAWVTVNDSPSLDLSTGMTLEAWVYPTAEVTGSTDVIMKQQSWSIDPKQGVSYYLAAGSRSGPPAGEVTVRNQQLVQGKSKVPASHWSHLATTFDGSHQRLYVNGALVASRQVQSGKITAGSGPLRIGGDALRGKYFQGMIDEVRIYNRALSVAEIQSDMKTPVSRAMP
jgi:concanavalin A-like lectin/glucanase superfamily protein